MKYIEQYTKGKRNAKLYNKLFLLGYKEYPYVIDIIYYFRRCLKSMISYLRIHLTD